MRRNLPWFPFLGWVKFYFKHVITINFCCNKCCVTTTLCNPGLTHPLLIFRHLSDSPIYSTNSSSSRYLSFPLTFIILTAVDSLYPLAFSYISWSYSVLVEPVKLSPNRGKLTLFFLNTDQHRTRLSLLLH
jgi:hypothetical protein